MAAVVSLILNSGDKTYLGARAIGDGAIAAGDDLITDVITYPLGSEYFDNTNHIHYKRVATAGVIGDWYKSAAYTVAS